MEKIERQILLAKSRTKKLVDLVQASLQLAANNDVALRSNKLADQIPKSYAANAFNEFSRSLRYYELIRLAALWDRKAKDRISIPTVIDLIRDDSVQAQLRQENFDYSSRSVAVTYRDYPLDISQQLTAFDIAFYDEITSNAASRLKKAIKVSDKIEESFRFKSLKHVRDNFLAHSLDQSTINHKSVIRSFKLGYERWLLLRAVTIVDALHIGVTGIGFSWDSSCQSAKRNAESLWLNCSFNIIE